MPAELSSEAKEAIRFYVLSLSVLPASLLSVLGFAIGWLINEGARGAAYTTAYATAQSQIIELATEIAGLRGAAEASADAASNASQAAITAEKQIRDSAAISKDLLAELEKVLSRP